jgi:tetratricopeptide (TPR) repeat protein
MPAITLGQRLLAKFTITIVVLVGLSACGGAEARKERYFEKAKVLVAEQDYDKAQIELRNALQIDPNYLEAQLMLADVASRLGDPRRAFQMYQAVHEQDEENPVARAGLARIYMFGGLPEKALELVEPGLVKNPNDAVLLTVRGAAKARLGDTAGAIADAEHALEQAPADENAVALLASLYAKEHRIDAAVALLEDAVGTHADSIELHLILTDLYLKSGNLRDAERMLRTVVELKPEQFSYRADLARFLIAEERIAEAEQVLRGAVEAIPDNLDAKAALVNLLASRDSFEAAEQQLLAFVEKSPKDLELRQLLGDFYAGRGQRDKAADVYREIVRTDAYGPMGLAARNRQASMAIAEKRIDVAEPLIAEVLGVNPQDNDALVLRADIALARGDTATAIADLRAVLRDQPTLVPVQRALAQAYLQSNDVALALETLNKAIETSPGNSQLRVDLAQVLVSSGEEDRALKSLEDVVAATPEDLAAQELLFRLQVAREDLPGARRTATAVKAARPDLPQGDYLLGLVSGAENKIADATASFEAALKLRPDAAEPLTALVGLLVSQGRAEDAIARVRRASAEQPQNAVARNLLGELLASRNRFPEALVAFDEAIALTPAWWVPHRGKALAQLATGDANAAMQTMRRGLDASGGAIRWASNSRRSRSGPASRMRRSRSTKACSSRVRQTTCSPIIWPCCLRPIAATPAASSGPASCRSDSRTRTYRRT